jgi:hypothetical protein
LPIKNPGVLLAQSSLQSPLCSEINTVEAIVLSKKIVQLAQKARVQSRILSMPGIGCKLGIEEEELSVLRRFINYREDAEMKRAGPVLLKSI